MTEQNKLPAAQEQCLSETSFTLTLDYSDFGFSLRDELIEALKSFVSTMSHWSLVLLVLALSRGLKRKTTLDSNPRAELCLWVVVRLYIYIGWLDRLDLFCLSIRR